MKQILAELRNRVVAAQAIIKLCAKGLKTEPQALIEIAMDLQKMAELLKEADAIK